MIISRKLFFTDHVFILILIETVKIFPVVECDKGKKEKGLMESIVFAEVLQKTDVPATVTEQFEKEYGQEKNRWWDNSTGTQKEHLVCWFSRKYYGGSTTMCIEKKNCESCYFKSLESIPPKLNEYKEQKDAGKVFEHMGRPEMFIYIAEVLQVLSKEQFEEYVAETKKAISSNEKWSDVRKKYLTWDMVEQKALEVLSRE